MSRPGPRLTQALLLTAAVAAFVGLGAIWLWRFRRGQPVDIDEAGYLAIAVSDARHLSDGGLPGFWDAFLAPSIQAPLMTALTAPLYSLVGPGVLTGLAVPLALGGVLLLAAYALGHEVGGARVGWLTLAMTAAAPVVIAYSRSYNFAIASGAAAALTLWLVARSHGFERLGSSAAAGAAIGLLALSRTVALAVLPAVVVIALVAIAVGPHRWRRLGGAGLAAGVALVVAGPWYDANGRRVWDYLTSYGYGRHSVEYGGQESLLSLGSWRDSLRTAMFQVGLPWAIAATAGLILGVVALAVAVRRRGFRATSLAVGRSPVLPSLVWVGWGMAVFTTSGNKGSGFLTLLVPAAALLVAWGVARLPTLPRRAATAVVVALLAVNSVALADPTTALAEPRTVGLPWLDDVRLLTGQGTIQDYLLAGQQPQRSGRLSEAEGRSWAAANRRLADALEAQRPGVVLFGFRHRVVNVNTVQLEVERRGHDPLSLGFVSPVETPNDVEAMEDWLTGPACTLVTARGSSYEFEPLVDALLMEQAAHHAGFRRSEQVALPDHRTVVVWRRPSSCPVTTGAVRAPR